MIHVQYYNLDIYCKDAFNWMAARNYFYVLIVFYLSTQSMCTIFDGVMKRKARNKLRVQLLGVYYDMNHSSSTFFGSFLRPPQSFLFNAINFALMVSLAVQWKKKINAPKMPLTMVHIEYNTRFWSYSAKEPSRNDANT